MIERLQTTSTPHRQNASQRSLRVPFQGKARLMIDIKPFKFGFPLNIVNISATGVLTTTDRQTDELLRVLELSLPQTLQIDFESELFESLVVKSIPVRLQKYGQTLQIGFTFSDPNVELAQYISEHMSQA